ncbi:MAG: PQQ-dependent sugar dehydrogenase, partial [Gammaproteobacteria bacterium]
VLQSELYAVEIETLVSGLEHPWGMAFLPDGDLLVTEKPGRLRRIHKGELQPQAIQGIPAVSYTGQGGLLDVTLDPDFADNQIIYLSYSAAGEGGIGTEVMRAKLQDNRLQQVETIFTLQPKTSAGQHFGSRLLFMPDGTLLISLGDRGNKDRAQDLNDHAGSLIRINTDGSVPADNPFVDRSDTRPGIYTWGNRNIQGMTLQPGTDRIWTSEHGPQGGDEINIMTAGTNYGWPVITYGVQYVIGTSIGEGTKKPGMEQPRYYWDPSIAPAGMTFYGGDAFSKWRGNLFVAALKFGMLSRLVIDDATVVSEERLFEGQLPRIRDIHRGPDDYLYLLTDESDGKLLRLKPSR